MSDLGAAHAGYVYQDLVTAICAVDVLLGTVTSVLVDTKVADGDVFDDLTVTYADGNRTRRQIKHQQNPKAMDVDTFVRDARDLRLDKLVKTANAERTKHPQVADKTTFRVYLRDLSSDDEILTAVLAAADPDPGPLFEGTDTERFTLDAKKIWAGVHRPRSGKRKAGDAFEFLREGKLAVDRADLEWVCERLTIETRAPAMSSDLHEPGPMEEILLRRIRRELGAGEYPNGHRSPVDVAAALIHAASKARSTHKPLERRELLRVTALRTDFGSVAQRTPVDDTVLIPRTATATAFADEVAAAARSGGFVVMEGAPGQGKSWLSHELLNALDERDWTVAEHYCYLNDSDIDRGDRVLTECIFGSLLDRLATAHPDCVHSQRPLLRADEAALIAAVANVVASTGKPVALVVDGIDHVTRVLGNRPGQTDPSEAIATELANLAPPPGCVVVVLSQPGTHLSPLKVPNAITLAAPAMDLAETIALAERLGCMSSATASGPVPAAAPSHEIEEWNHFTDALYDRSQGNPLYATYLCREAQRADSEAISPADRIRKIPAYTGSIESYYNHVASILDVGGQAAADVMALIEFPLNADELKQIAPEQQHRIDAALTVLGPVLRVCPGGGLRIYHESFARFLRRHMDAYPDTRKVRLESIASWLLAQGLFTDARAFNSLLPTLRDIGRHQDVVELVDRDFAVHAVAGGFSAAAVRTNLATAVDSAGHTGDWPAIARFVELVRAVEAYERERFAPILARYLDVQVAVLGLDTAAERLLYDGRTVVGADDGVIMCAGLDRLGVVPPWDEYLDLWHGEHFDADPECPARIEPEVELAALHGRLRLARAASGNYSSPLGTATDEDELTSTDAVPNDTDVPGNDSTPDQWLDPALPSAAEEGRTELDELIDFAIQWAGKNPGLSSTRDLVDVLSATLDEKAVVSLEPRMAHRGTYCLAIAEKVHAGAMSPANGDALEWAMKAHHFGAAAGEMHRLKALGVPLPADPVSNPTRASLLDTTSAVQGKRPEYHLGHWIDLLVAVAHDPLTLDAIEAAVAGDGWYRGWLKFQIGLVRAEAGVPQDQSALAYAAMGHLKNDLRPYAGSPRAVDLYWARNFIDSSIERVVALLDEEHWRPGIDLLFEVSSAVNRSLQGEMGSLLPPDKLLLLAIETAPRAELNYTRGLIDRELNERSTGRYYSDIAEYKLMAARLELRRSTTADGITQAQCRSDADGETDASRTADAESSPPVAQNIRDLWTEACTLFLGYGFHKDIAIFEILEPVTTITEYDRPQARMRLEWLQPLCYRVWRHSDTKETAHAPTLWWAKLADADPRAHAEMLAARLLADCDNPSTFHEMRQDLWDAHFDGVDPRLAAAHALTLSAAPRTPPYLKMVASLTDLTDEIAQVLLRQSLTRGDEICPWLSADPDPGLVAHVEALNTIALTAGLRPTTSHSELPRSSEPVADEAADAQATVGANPPSATDDAENQEISTLVDTAPEGPDGLAHLVRGWRKHEQEPRGESPTRFDAVAKAIAERLKQLVDAGRAEEVLPYLRSLADLYDIRNSHKLLAGIGAMLATAGEDAYRRPAAQAYALAWTQARSRGGFARFGGRNAIELLHRATSLNAAATREILVEAISSAVASARSDTIGITQNLIYALLDGALPAGSDTPQVTAMSVWDEAFAIIHARAPSVGDDGTAMRYTAPNPDRSEITDTELSDAFALATFAGLAQPGREDKRRTLMAVRHVAAVAPESFRRALPSVLKALTNVATLTWLLTELVDLCRTNPFLLDAAAAELQELMRSPYLGVRSRARRLRPAPAGTTVDAGPSDPASFPVPAFGMSPQIQKAASIVVEVAEDRMARVEERVEGYVEAVLETVARQIECEEFRVHVGRVLRSLSGATERWPDAVLPSVHITEAAMQQVGGAARAKLATRGVTRRDPIEWEDEVATLIAHSQLPLLAEATRVPRPNLDRPAGPGDAVWECIATSDATSTIREDSLTDAHTSVAHVSVASSKTSSSNSEPSNDTVHSPDTPTRSRQDEIHGTYLGDDLIIACLNDDTWIRDSGDGSPFAGWITLASVEKRRSRSARMSSAEPDMVSILVSGAELFPATELEAHVKPPLGSASVNQWFEPLRRVIIDDHNTIPLACRAEVDSGYVDDAAGLGLPDRLLAPAPELVQLLDLRATGELVLDDTQGPAVSLITWRSDYSHSGNHLSYPRLIGTALLIRPDLFTALKVRYGTRLQMRRHLGGSAALCQPTSLRSSSPRCSSHE
ncbi:hypothetical protein GS462_00315 [Rhodococcus hoagii]|nr:hypothetical protein [Prescottella equi]MBM4648854.1 hypothetical protein [Prescottella equi]MBM4687068.1 hypothetical protein [Prescottella equi]